MQYKLIDTVIVVACQNSSSEIVVNKRPISDRDHCTYRRSVMPAPMALTEPRLPEENNQDDGDDFSTIRNQAEYLSDEEAERGVGEGDYSSRMEEIFSESGDGVEDLGRRSDADDDDDDEGFVYTGQDAEKALGGYREQLRDVLGAEVDESESEDERLIERSLLQNEEDVYTPENSELVSTSSKVHCPR